MTYIVLTIIKKAFVHYNGEYLEYPIAPMMLVNFFYVYGMSDSIFAVLPINPILLTAAFNQSKETNISKWNLTDC